MDADQRSTCDTVRMRVEHDEMFQSRGNCHIGDTMLPTKIRTFGVYCCFQRSQSLHYRPVYKFVWYRRLVTYRRYMAVFLKELYYPHCYSQFL